MRIIGTLRNSIHLQAQDGKTYCNAQNQWKECIDSTFRFSRKDAPAWLISRFTPVPDEEAAVMQLTLAGNYATGNTYFALFENNRIWSCVQDFNVEIEEIVSSTLP